MHHTKHSNDKTPAPRVPSEYAGKWIAWDHAHTRIIASGRTFRQARRKALQAGENDPLMDKVPSATERFVGGAAE